MWAKKIALIRLVNRELIFCNLYSNAHLYPQPVPLHYPYHANWSRHCAQWTQPSLKPSKSDVCSINFHYVFAVNPLQKKRFFCCLQCSITLICLGHCGTIFHWVRPLIWGLMWPADELYNFNKQCTPICLQTYLLPHWSNQIGDKWRYCEFVANANQHWYQSRVPGQTIQVSLCTLEKRLICLQIKVTELSPFFFEYFFLRA